MHPDICWPDAAFLPVSYSELLNIQTQDFHAARDVDVGCLAGFSLPLFSHNLGDCDMYRPQEVQFLTAQRLRAMATSSRSGLWSVELMIMFPSTSVNRAKSLVCALCSIRENSLPRENNVSMCVYCCT